MTHERLIKILEDPSQLASIPYEELKTLALAYPYAHNFRVMLAIKGQQEGNPNYRQDLAVAAMYSLDRKRLFQLLSPPMPILQQVAIRREETLQLQPIQQVKEALMSKRPTAQEELTTPAPVIKLAQKMVEPEPTSDFSPPKSAVAEDSTPKVVENLSESKDQSSTVPPSQPKVEKEALIKPTSEVLPVPKPKKSDAVVFDFSETLRKQSSPALIQPSVEEIAVPQPKENSEKPLATEKPVAKEVPLLPFVGTKNAGETAVNPPENAVEPTKPESILAVFSEKTTPLEDKTPEKSVASIEEKVVNPKPEPTEPKPNTPPVREVYVRSVQTNAAANPSSKIENAAHSPSKAEVLRDFSDALPPVGTDFSSKTTEAEISQASPKTEADPVQEYVRKLVEAKKNAETTPGPTVDVAIEAENTPVFSEKMEDPKTEESIIPAPIKPDSRVLFAKWASSFQVPSLAEAQADPLERNSSAPLFVQEVRAVSKNIAIGEDEDGLEDDSDSPATDREKEARDFAARSVADNREIVSETLARLYARQGLKSKAIEMYQRLSLVFPEKGAYFAAAIEELKIDHKN